MAVAGVGWGFYSLQGRTATDPLSGTAGNFARSVPMVALVGAASLGELRKSRSSRAKRSAAQEEHRPRQIGVTLFVDNTIDNLTTHGLSKSP
jgi:hypothetical protein